MSMLCNVHRERPSAYSKKAVRLSTVMQPTTKTRTITATITTTTTIATAAST